LVLKKVVIIGFFLIFGTIFLISLKNKKNENKLVQEVKVEEIAIPEVSEVNNEEEKVDFIDRLFIFDSSKLPIVETIVYTSRVPWLKGRRAWIADYASHYKTTRHFIARSLNRKMDYDTQKIAFGDRFNVLKEGVSFYLLIDISKLKLFFYGIDEKENKRYLLKTYKVGLGRKDVTKESGTLTPLGKFSLGSKVAKYKTGIMGYFQDRQIEMVKIFGTRWIPFDKEVEKCSDMARGYGIHGAPWKIDAKDGILKEDRETVGKYDSDGCIRLYQEDIEEIFAIVISRPTIVELIDDYKKACLPKEEVAIK